MSGDNKDGRAGPGHAADERHMDKDPNRFPGDHRPQASDTQTRAGPIAGSVPEKSKERSG